VLALWVGERYQNGGPISVARIDPARAGPGRGPVSIYAVRFSGSPENYMVDIRGSGFGASPFVRPFRGTTPYLRFSDVTERFEAGYSGDAVSVAYLRWNDRHIKIGSVQARPGNCISLMLWNPWTRVGAAWGGFIHPRRLRIPRITSASVSPPGKITIVGAGFGISPETLPFESNDNFVVLSDAAYHPWGDGESLPFTVGGKSMDTKLRFILWTDKRIVISGFTGPLPPDGMHLAAGDPIGLVFWNQRNYRAAAWGGTAR
jgi:hypothetical protein